MIRVFISHRGADELRGLILSVELMRLGVESYVDATDQQLRRDAGDLAAYLREKLTECTHLVAVVSDVTAGSWWVPFKIGLATEQKNWPYLTSTADLEDYVGAAKQAEAPMTKSLLVTESSERGDYAQRFHRNLRRRLGQT